MALHREDEGLKWKEAGGKVTRMIEPPKMARKRKGELLEKSLRAKR